MKFLSESGKISILLSFHSVLIQSPALPEDPMDSALSVRPSVCNADFSELAHYFFHIFCIILRFHKCNKVTEFFFEKNLFYAQNGINGAFLSSKSTFNFSRNVH